MKKLFTPLALAAALISAPSFAADPEDLIDARQGAYKVIGYEFGGQMAAMLRGKKEFDLERMKVAVARIQNVSGILPEAFAVESTAPNSDAKPEIWTDQEGFFAVAVAFGESLGELSAAVETGDRGQIAPAFRAVADNCQACHDDYRK